MKIIAFLVSTASVSAFAPTASLVGRTSSTSSLQASRREFVWDTVAGAMGAATILATTMNPSAATAADKRPTYLEEPTEEFKANEEKSMAFKREQMAIKKEFVAALERLTTELDDETKLEADLRALQSLVAKTGGLPLGIKKEEVYKQIRARKAKGFWPTSVEVA